MNELNLVDTFFEVAEQYGLTAPAARRILATELDRPSLADYRTIWDYKNRDELPANIINYMINYCIQYVIDNYPVDEWATRLSPPVHKN